MNSNSLQYIRENCYYKRFDGKIVGPAKYVDNIKDFCWYISGEYYSHRGSHWMSPAPLGEFLQCEVDKNGNSLPDLSVFDTADINYAIDVIDQSIENFETASKEIEDSEFIRQIYESFRIIKTRRNNLRYEENVYKRKSTLL